MVKYSISKNTEILIGFVCHHSWHSSRQLARGIYHFCKSSENISVHLIDFEELAGTPVLQRYSGFLIEHYAEYQNALLKHFPVVYLDYLYPPENSNSILIDNGRVGGVAAEYLTATDFIRFGYCDYKYTRSAVASDPEGTSRTDLRLAGFKARLLELNMLPDESALFVHHIEEQNYKLPSWLKSLPKPIALLCQNDAAASNVIQACKFLDIEVPEEVSVIGVDNDNIICNLSYPRITSIDANFVQLGQEGMKLLECIIRNENTDHINFLIPPGEVVSRDSTSRFNSGSNKKPSGLHAALPNLSTDSEVSRQNVKSSSEKILDDISEAASLLRTTTVSIKEISQVTGFSSYAHFLRNFKRRMSVTPSQYRKKFLHENRNRATTVTHL